MFSVRNVIRMKQLSKKKNLITIAATCLLLFAGVCAYVYGLQNLMRVFDIMALIGGGVQLLIGVYLLLRKKGFIKAKRSLSKSEISLIPISLICGFLMIITIVGK